MARTSITRRGMLQTAGAAGLVGLAGCAGGTGGGGGTMKLGVLQPVSGDLAYYGQQSLWGFYSGLAYKGDTDPVEEVQTGTETVTVNDTEFELIVRDTQFSPDTAQSAATDLVENDEVDMLFGCTSSGSARRVVNTVVSASDVPLMIGPAASAGITSNAETCSELVFRASENTAMDARSGGKYVAQNTDVSSVYLFGADYSFGRAVVNNYETVLRQNDVEIVGKRFVPRGYDQWDGLLQNAADEGADGIVGGFTVATLPQLFTAYLQGGFDYTVFGGFATQITNNIVGGVLQNILGEPLTQQKLDESGLGPFTTRYHWNQYDNDINSSFVDLYTDAYGRVPDLFSSGTFTAASAIVQAIEEGGSTEGADIAEALKGMTVTDTPKGEDGYTFQEYNNQARSAMTVANIAPTSDEFADSWGAPIQPSTPVARIPKSETTIPADAENMGCSL